MPRDDAFYQIWILDALKHVRYWMGKMGLSLEMRRRVWRFMMESER